MNRYDFIKINFDSIIIENLKRSDSIHISPLYGSSKSFAVRELFEIEKQIVLLFAETKLVNEIKVELSVLGLTDHLIVIDDFNLEFIQEKLTEISKREKFILISTYQILSLSLPEKRKQIILQQKFLLVVH